MCLRGLPFDHRSLGNPVSFLIRASTLLGSGSKGICLCSPPGEKEHFIKPDMVEARLEIVWIGHNPISWGAFLASKPLD